MNSAECKIFGIDFSGARDAGKRIWITKGVGDGQWLRVMECLMAKDLPNSGTGIKACLSALVLLIESNSDAAFGFDFPFGIPAALVQESTWNDFVSEFPRRFASPEDFRKKCFDRAGRKELRREADREAHTPFSPYNLRIYKQTYHGISGVLRPLVQNAGAFILPFHAPVDGKPWGIEICPASTLKSLGLGGFSYKGGGDIRKRNRVRILEGILRSEPVSLSRKEIGDLTIEDKGGDALDSLIAAVSTFRTIRQPRTPIPGNDGLWKIEGHVYL